ncbi:Hpt domain-containing protein [Oceanimonas sp. GK1]|jgi:HPt (histidine-containing phosphotransfer) domain-containing protein|uniref:Hpt domain-containing protein n=1 Tax=Oceanimonas sp. (strain GK1 / IBRC-M 10197) TaxID=511062 RepID=UPI0002495455|nr:Hpt domain-containing protein [Oceanimonas sp. GK1]AEY01972.1 Hpt domain-containing protein [Oceanimonas sp. GK1]
MADWQQLHGRLPLLDLSRLEQLERDLGSEALDRLLRLFAEDGVQQGASLADAFAAQDDDGMARWCHSLKSACGSYGALRCQFLAEKLEAACRRHEQVEIVPLMQAWQQALNDTLLRVEGRLEPR